MGPVRLGKGVLFVMGVGKLRRLVGSTVVIVMQLGMETMGGLVESAAEVAK